MALFDQLDNVYSQDELGNRKYIPRNELERLITRDTVEQELRRTQKRGVRNLFRAKRSLRENLAERVMESGQKLFATCVYLSQPWDVKLLLDANFTDDDLPVTKNAKSLKSSEKQFDWPAAWELPKLDVFIDKQWLFLAPIFSTTGTHQSLDTMCPLPFLKVEEEQHGMNNVVFQAMIHESHQKGFAVGLSAINDGFLL